MPKIILTDKLNEKAVEVLENAGFEVKIAWDLPKEDLPLIIGEYDAVIVRGATKVRGDLLEKAVNLKVIGRAGVGLDNIDLETTMARGIKVVNTPAATTNSVAELALTMVLSSTRDVVKGTCEIKSDPSSFKTMKKELFSSEIDGKILGLVGAGRRARYDKNAMKSPNISSCLVTAIPPTAITRADPIPINNVIVEK